MSVTTGIIVSWTISLGRMYSTIRTIDTYAINRTGELNTGTRMKI